MSDALVIAASGLKSEDYLINALANDIANLNTPNYKASKLIFEDVLYRHNPSIGLGARILETKKDFSNGPLKPTDQWNNVAIEGPGFFQVINNDGDRLYTRNSILTIDEDHYLATSDGLRLEDAIQIPDEFVSIIIQKNGDVEALIPDNSEPQYLGTIRLAQFLNPEELTPIGSGLYQLNTRSGDPIVDIPGLAGIGQLLQKHIESSNVDMVSSLMQLTMAQRVYQMNAKTMQIADEMEKIINEIRE
jgi:flagellar basal-body rod protein FlgG